MRRPPRFDEIGEEYVRQIVDLSPGQRKRYLGQLRVLAATRVHGEPVFTRPITSIAEADLRARAALGELAKELEQRAHDVATMVGRGVA